ncbi:hypothetical protein D4764_10G0005160 [Takifugu flavidus]|uniref:Uncharacterized protein n=1 Tax=Takifugu flavidus TaxID=433684 RepID=A0A5C6PKS1_9TELE|nr:hypothetical protein D4764_10G0005160 [Takifugu flavidus]
MSDGCSQELAAMADSGAEQLGEGSLHLGLVTLASSSISRPRYPSSRSRDSRESAPGHKSAATLFKSSQLKRAERSRNIIPSSAESDDRLSASGFFYAIETLFATPPESDSDRIYCDGISAAAITALADWKAIRTHLPGSDQRSHPDISQRC